MKRKPFSAYKQRELTLPMGEPHQCFKNATAAVLKYPNRLLYVEGFIGPGPKDSDYMVPGYAFFHHAWCVDKVTGKRHEVSPIGDDHIYIGKEFTRDELRVFRGHPDFVGDETIDSPDEWTAQLTMAEQLELLTGAGYEVELLAMYNNGDDGIEVVDPATIDMSTNVNFAECRLMESKGTENDPSGFSPKTGWPNWHYQWVIKDKEPAAPAPVEAQAVGA
jgi:hypothetical protein